MPPQSPEEISGARYATKEVKRRLNADQHSKCIYCETKLVGGYGNVEHYRPKAGYTSTPGGKLITPGYYWLVYDWRNLIMSCSECNTSCKKMNFALADESKRDIAGRDISRESPLLINPATENPDRFLFFRDEIAVPRLTPSGAENPRGRYTIDVMRLNDRRLLLEERKRLLDRYRMFRTSEAIARKAQDNPALDAPTKADMAELAKALRAEMQAMKAIGAEYSAMLLHEPDVGEEVELQGSDAEK